MARSLSHGEMIEKVWPDKALFGAVMLFITGVVGVLFVAFEKVVDVSFSDKVPGFLRNYPWLATLLLSLATLLCAGMSLRERNTVWALWGALAGFLSFGLLGVGSLLSLVALVFLIFSRLEREDFTPETLRLTSDQWPDKSLAASLLLLMVAIVDLVWGAALVGRFLTLELGRTALFGEASLLAGLVCLFAATQLYYQRGWWIGVIAALAGIASLGFYVVGPALSLAGLVLVILAFREREFDKRTQANASAKAAR